ncbi:alpha/beta-hydrolase [Lentinus brumalis]|uniref:Alpha/beta-hydrolase n=1 Tax=Lentinus brumalis TaxID=2498619 RepID=A0A371CQJ7_9APHY|nr:alpha/beta-hydrolase [Polyporus brumalis]
MAAATSTEESFKLAIPDADLELLRKKLDLVRLPDELDGAEWDYGVPLDDVKRLVAHWQEKFDWRKSEAKINELPMFTRDIEVEGFGTLNAHYVHQRSEVDNAIPLLFVHGWPGHFLEVRKILPLLTAKSPDHPSFHVVAPSLPGFGFSGAIKKTGFKGPQYAEFLNKLMISLGYNEYVYQGGDWGHILGLQAVTHYGHKHIKAWHSNMPLPGARPSPVKNPLIFLSTVLSAFSQEGRANMQRAQQFAQQGTGYSKMQSTKPQTLAYGLTDSPVGLLAWIYEKLVIWSDKYPWGDDEVLEWVSIYWFSRAGPGAAGRIYYEMANGGTGNALDGNVWQSVPLGISYFPGEVVRLPRSWSHLIGKLVFEGEHEKGGHFAAHEAPEGLVGDLRKMYGKGGPAYGVVPGKDGYSA